jgi:hypothetical protein
MPQLTFPVSKAGLIVPVWIGLDGKTTSALLAAGQPIPAPVQARGLVDTGSDLTAVAPWILGQLAVPVAASASTHTAAGQVSVNLYEVSVSITDPAQTGAPMLTHPGVRVSELAVSLPDADVLIGLNVLFEGRLLLDGPARQFTLEL